MMKQWISVAAFACLIGSASFVAAQTPAGGGGSTAKPQGGSGAGSTAKPQGGSGAGSTAKPHDAGTHAQDGPAAADAMFIRTAGMDGMAEVEHGRLAAQNATHDEVKQFGQRMVEDHGKANDELKSLASQKKVTLPAELDAKHKAMHDKLSKMKGDTFDKAYMAHMVTAHQQAVGLFTKESSGGKDADVKAWAGKTLPTLQEHLKMARGINAKVAGGKTAPAEKK
jgi:putative membrane protein